MNDQHTKTLRGIAIVGALILAVLPGCSDDGAYDSGGYYDESQNGPPDPAFDPTPGPMAGPMSSPESAPSGAPPRIREYFPETLYFHPDLRTDADGDVVVPIELADSITTWRATAMVSDELGRTGVASADIAVFQPFFVDIGAPVHVTRLDQVQIPVAIFNYLDAPQTVEIRVQLDEWFRWTRTGAVGGGEVLAESVEIPAGGVMNIELPIEALEVGTHPLTVTAHSEHDTDAIRRVLRVRPNGVESSTTLAGVLDASTDSPTHIEEQEFVVPELNLVPGSADLRIQVKPSPTAELLAGIDGLLRTPGSTCFEVTTSIAWPNALILNFLEGNDADAEIMKAAQAMVSDGYQRVLAFELREGGFNWWADAPAGNPMLSAMSMMMLIDTERAGVPVNPALMDRTARYLMSVQREDGSWPEEQSLKPGNKNLGESSTRATCFVAWAMADAGYEESASAAMKYVRQRSDGPQDPYADALCANAAVAADPDSALAEAMIDRLAESAVSSGSEVYWTASSDTLVGAQGDAADVEVTALAIQALARFGGQQSMVEGAVTWLLGHRDARGNWGMSTQATVQALRAITQLGLRDREPTDAELLVSLDGEVLGRHRIDAFNEDVVWSLGEHLDGGEHTLRVVLQGEGRVSFDARVRHFESTQAAEGPAPVQLAVEAPSDGAAVGDVLPVVVSLTPHELVGMGMWTASIPLPAGFTLVATDLDVAKAQRLINSYEVRDGLLTIYIDEQKMGRTRTVRFGLLAEMGADVMFGPFEVYEYYNPGVRVAVDETRLVVAQN